MQLHEAIMLIQNDYLLNQRSPSVWADLGCGSGLFTQALSHYLKPGSIIYAVDKVNRLDSGVNDRGIEIIPFQSDFETDTLPMAKLDGILMANSLHYVKDQYSFLMKCKQSIGNEVFLIIEYDTDMPVAKWVPYPISFSALNKLFKVIGFNAIDILGERPSFYGRNTMYAALIQ